jgi:hypothetical protein
MTEAKFRKMGKAYRTEDGMGGYLWIRRSAPHTYALVREYRDPTGATRCGTLATHRTKAAAIADANALLAN